jgi:glycosyltransferase involved in cell wall biosynthesis
MSKPFVTVLIDTYNQERFIEQAVVSVLEQDFPSAEVEVIVVDDGSRDRTPEIVGKFAPRVRYLWKPNGGQASAFNAGIPETRGEIVAFLDGDDWWAKSKLRTVVEVFGRHADVGVVGHGFYRAHTDGRPLGAVVPERTYRLHLRSLDGARLFDRLKGFLGTSKVAMRRSVLERILPVPEELVFEADEFLWTSAVAVADAIVLDQPLFYYRFHGGNFFMFQEHDEARARRRYQVLANLAKQLPARMRALGVSGELIPVALASLQVEVDMLRLSLEGGRPWEMFRTERAAYRLAYREAGAGYRLFKAAVLALTLILPPRRFCQLKRWYTARGFARIRRLVGEPVPATPVVELRGAEPRR